jgi:hypothetical protein
MDIPTKEFVLAGSLEELKAKGQETHQSAFDFSLCLRISHPYTPRSIAAFEKLILTMSWQIHRMRPWYYKVVVSY